MNKAKFILIAIALIAFVGGILAFKVNRSDDDELWRLNGQFTTYTTFINGRTYSTVLAICVRADRWPTTVGTVVNTLYTDLGFVPFYHTTNMPPTTYTTFVLMTVCLETMTRTTSIQ